MEREGGMASGAAVGAVRAGGRSGWGGSGWRAQQWEREALIPLFSCLLSQEELLHLLARDRDVVQPRLLVAITAVVLLKYQRVIL